ncbi:TIGR01620 family protein [Meridianimarinicoccus roseus]|uniref:TIGR01620 family protein n=1 Tax=Meridianimarinicoccus roseus TaxID=2072018 RepID=A0A2V2LG19_9RHOB|nr:YcjF family protein [Meridianimarinicoccus roseus]PWR04415.1 TIGR01620 family protein [Meridianimarinicoccus roseus]
MSIPKGPVLIELEADPDPAPSPADAPPVPEDRPDGPQGAAAMQRLARFGVRPRNRLAGWFWGLLGALLLAFASLAMWSVVYSLLARNAVLGSAVTGLLVAFGAVCAAIVLRELAAFSRLTRIDRMQHRAAAALADDDLAAARALASDLAAFYERREELSWALDGLGERVAASFDADATLGLLERDLLAPLDRQATLQVEAAARQVATVTALVPLALADVVAAATANLRMIRSIAEIYGGRSGTLGTWRLMRAVMTHLVATGAVAVGDDLISSVAGGSLVSRISRRFGEGVVNGALTARVGVAAMEVCRPLPFRTARRPSVSGLVKRALAGLFGQGA